MENDVPVVFQAVWPILDQERTLDSLKKEAFQSLPQMMHGKGVRRDGPAHWAVLRGTDMPGWHAHNLILVYTCVTVNEAQEARRNGIR